MFPFFLILKNSYCIAGLKIQTLVDMICDAEISSLFLLWFLGLHLIAIWIIESFSIYYFFLIIYNSLTNHIIVENGICSSLFEIDYFLFNYGLWMYSIGSPLIMLRQQFFLTNYLFSNGYGDTLNVWFRNVVFPINLPCRIWLPIRNLVMLDIIFLVVVVFSSPHISFYWHFQLFYFEIKRSLSYYVTCLSCNCLQREYTNIRVIK